MAERKLEKATKSFELKAAMIKISYSDEAKVTAMLNQEVGKWLILLQADKTVGR